MFDEVSLFDYNRIVTREEASKMIGNFVKNILHKDYLRSEDDKQCKFTDLNMANPGLVNAIQESCRYGIFNGTSQKQFLPQETLKNSHAIATVLRSSYGYQNESATPWFSAYADLLQKKDLGWKGFTSSNNLSVLESQGMTRGNLGELMYRVAIDIFTK